MSVEIVSGSPLAETLKTNLQPKLIELGWTTGGMDDSALSEYIVLMLVNGQTQEQLAHELSNELLNLPAEDRSAEGFATWLFEQIDVLNAQLNGGTAPGQEGQQVQDISAVGVADADSDVTAAQQDTAMSDDLGASLDGAVPKGPKAMRSGNGNGVPQKGRDKRMLGHMNNAMDRTRDSSLHRIKGAANTGRVNTHNNRTEPPRGPKGQLGRMMNMRNGPPGVPQGMNMNPQVAQNMLGTSPQQQMQLLQLLEEQSRAMAQMLSQGGHQPAINPAFFGGGNGKGPAGKSLFERVEGQGRGRQNGNQRGGRGGGGAGRPAADPAIDTDAAMDGTDDKQDPSATPCKFQLGCTSATCHFAHQSPAAPAGAAIDVTDKCSFGAACMNKKCTGTHPSPAQRRQHLSSAVDCKFFPNCTNPSCPFRHPSSPPCRNGADCPTKDKGCKFSHSTVTCRYNPCLNPSCVFSHAEGQKRGKFQDKVWTPGAGGLEGVEGEGFDREAAERAGDPQRQHVSERKFVADEGVEEVILPGQSQDQSMDGGGGQDVSVTETAVDASVS